MTFFLRTLAVTAALVVAAPAYAQPAAQPASSMQRMRGTITKIGSHVLTLKQADDGKPVTVMLPAGVKILSVSRASLTDIKPDSFVGTAATPRPDVTLKALEVHIFAPSLRGSGEVFRPWQGAAGATGRSVSASASGRPQRHHPITHPIAANRIGSTPQPSWRARLGATLGGSLGIFG